VKEVNSSRCIHVTCYLNFYRTEAHWSCKLPASRRKHIYIEWNGNRETRYYGHQTTITTNHLDVYYYFSIICCLWLFHFGEPQYTYQHMLTVQLICFIYMKMNLLFY